jgi:hypothetical protein
MIRNIIAVTQGIIRDSAARRKWMTGSVVGAAAMLFIGVTALGSWLVDRPFVFFVYWFACCWLTMLAILIALYDILILRRDSMRARRDMARRIVNEIDEQKKDGGRDDA